MGSNEFKPRRVILSAQNPRNNSLTEGQEDQSKAELAPANGLAELLLLRPAE